jgi:phospholipase/carboxylesterase
LRYAGFCALIAALLLGAGQATSASAQTAPTATAQGLSPGINRLTKAALVYRPAQLTGPSAVIILLHGAGGRADHFLKEFTRFADERGVLLLALQSDAGSWPRRPQEVSRGPDAANFDKALAALTERAPVDSARVVLLGFSDGASHALSFGLARPKTFRAILAMSPGYAFAPRRPDPTQPIFIAHGRRDTVLPADNVREMIKGLEGTGYRPEVRWFNGGHRIDPDLLNAGLDFALGKVR